MTVLVIGILTFGALLATSAGVLKLRDYVDALVWRRRNPPEKRAADRRAYEERILRPDWSFYETHLGRAAPPALQDLYATADLVTRRDVRCGEHEVISSFEPLDAQGLREALETYGLDAVPIATTDCSDPIFLRRGAAVADVVYVLRADGGETEVLAQTPAELIGRLGSCHDRR